MKNKICFYICDQKQSKKQHDELQRTRPTHSPSEQRPKPAPGKT
jgi:hypothetical protein